MQQQEEKVALSTDDLILIQLRELRETVRDIKGEVKDTRKELNDRMNRIEQRIDRLEERIAGQDAKLDRLASKIESSSNHGQISTITTIGIALAVIYSVLK